MHKVLILSAIAFPNLFTDRQTSVFAEKEQLPTPEARQSLRPNQRSSTFYERNSPTYNQNEAYNSLVDNRRKKGVEEWDSKDDLIQSSSNFGGYASSSGYGKSCVQGYVNASAVALLAFLFLLNIVQDIIQQITQANVRRKRGVEDEQSEVMQFISDGGLEAMQEGLPRIVIALMIQMVDAERDECLESPLCEANLKISQSYGALGRVFSYLLSNVVSNAFSKADPPTLSRMLDAASEGRTKGSCILFKPCTPSTKIN